jgi:hypothetical protein
MNAYLEVSFLTAEMEKEEGVWALAFCIGLAYSILSLCVFSLRDLIQFDFRTAIFRDALFQSDFTLFHPVRSSTSLFYHPQINESRDGSALSQFKESRNSIGARKT